jgi:hypothetical protein
MNRIIKFFGLPHTGTNLLENLLTLNLKADVCHLASYHPNYHYLGWKHGMPKSMNVYETIGNHKKEKYYFIFLIREFENWKKAVLERHYNTWEFPKYYANFQDGIVYNTPQGPEIYNSVEQLYNTYNGNYKKYTEMYPDRCLVVKFEDLVSNQKQTLIDIKNKFNFEFSHETIYEVKKKVDSGGRIKNYTE